MKEMFRSFRIFTGAYTIKSTIQMLATFFGIFGAMSLLSAIPVKEDSFAAGFFSSFLPGISMFVPMTGAFLLNALYTYNLSMTPGYKYLHSIPDSEKTYRYAIAAANIVALAMMLVAIALHALVFNAFQLGLAPMFSAIVALLAIGCINFLGNVKKQWLRLFLMMPIFVGSGFVFGFSSAIEDEGGSIPEIAVWIAFGVALAAYFAGLIYSLVVCEKKWRRE